MGRQSSRLYFEGKDHKDIYFQGHYHKAMYAGAQKVWEKLTSRWKTKYYLHHPAHIECEYACNGETAVLCDTRNGKLKITDDFNTFAESIIKYKNYEDTVPEPETVYTIGKDFYVISKGHKGSPLTEFPILHRSQDNGKSWEEIDTLIFDTNGFLSTLKLFKGRYYYSIDLPEIVVLNDTAFMYIGERKSEEYDDANAVSGNDYAHLIGGVYKSTDFKHWKSLYTHFFRYELSNGKINFYPVPIYKGKPFLYRDGYYYLIGEKLDTTLDYFEATNNPSEATMLRRTKDFINFQTVSDEILYTYKLHTFGEYVYAEGKGLTKDFVNYIEPKEVLNLDIPPKEIKVQGTYGEYSLYYDIDKNSDLPYTSATEFDTYILTVVSLSNVKNIYTASSGYTSEYIYGRGVAAIIIDKKSMKVEDIFPVFHPVYLFEDNTILENDAYDFALTIRKFFKVPGKEIFLVPTYTRVLINNGSGTLIIEKEEG